VIHPKTLLISRHFYSLESYVWRSIYNLKIDTISTYDIPLDRSFLKLWNGIRHVMPSTDRRLELKEKTSMAQNAWQASVYANGLNNQPDTLIIPNLFCYKTLHVSGIFSARHQEFSTVHLALVSFMQVSDDHFQAESVPSWLCLEAVIRNLHEAYHCQMYSTKLLMMGREDARNM